MESSEMPEREPHDASDHNSQYFGALLSLHFWADGSMLVRNVSRYTMILSHSWLGVQCMPHDVWPRLT